MEEYSFLDDLTIYKAESGAVWCLPQKARKLVEKYGELSMILDLGFEVKSERIGNDCVALAKTLVKDARSGKIDITVNKISHNGGYQYTIRNSGIQYDARTACELLIMELAEHYTEQSREVLLCLVTALLFSCKEQESKV